MDDSISNSTSNSSMFYQGINRAQINVGETYVGKFLNSNLFHAVALTSLVPMVYAGWKSERYAKILSALMIFYIIVVILLIVGISEDIAVATILGILGLVIAGLILAPATLLALLSSWYFAYEEYTK